MMYICSRFRNVDRFGLLATTKKNAKIVAEFICYVAFLPNFSPYVIII